MCPQAQRRAISPSALRGEIQSTTIPGLFHDLWTSSATGVLACTEEGITKSIQIKDGRLHFASSNDRDDRLNQVMLKARVVSLQNLLKALEVALSTKDRLGEVLVKWKMASQKDVDACVRSQVWEITLSLFHWTRGQFAFEPGVPDRESVTIGETGDAIVIEGVRRIHSWGRVYEQVGGINAEYLATNDASRIVRDLPLKPEERALLGRCSEPTSLGEMCADEALSDYETCKVVWALLLVGALMRV